MSNCGLCSASFCIGITSTGTGVSVSDVLTRREPSTVMASSLVALAWSGACPVGAAVDGSVSCAWTGETEPMLARASMMAVDRAALRAYPINTPLVHDDVSPTPAYPPDVACDRGDRKSVVQGKSVLVGVGLGGARSM